MWAHISGADLHGQACHIPEYFCPRHSFLVPPACGLGWAKGLGLDQSQLCYITPLSVALSSLPGVDGVFCRLQDIFRVSCICFSCFLVVYIGGGFHLAVLLNHLLATVCCL